MVPVVIAVAIPFTGHPPLLILSEALFFPRGIGAVIIGIVIDVAHLIAAQGVFHPHFGIFFTIHDHQVPDLFL